MRWQDPERQAKTFEDFVSNALKNYCKHGSNCPVVLALASNYPGLLKNARPKTTALLKMRPHFE
jgi:hypothetical protein